MSDVIRGLQAGYGLMDGYLRTQDHLENQKELRADRKLQRERNTELFGLQKQKYANDQTLFDNQQEQYEYDVGRRQKATEQEDFLYDQEKKNIKQTNQIHDQQIKANQRAQLAQRQADAMQYFDYVTTNGMFNEQTFNELMQMAQGTQFGNILNLETQAAISDLAKTMDSNNMGKLVAGTSDRYEPIPEIEAADKILQPELRKVVGTPSKTGRPISDIKFVGFEQGKKGLRMKVLVSDDQGQVYGSYVRDLRSSNPNDPVKELTPDMLMEQVAAMDYIVKHMKDTGVQERIAGFQNYNRPQNKAAADLQAEAQTYSALTGKPVEEVANQMLFNQSQHNAAPLTAQQALKLAQDQLKTQQFQMSPEEYQKAVNQQAQTLLQQYGNQPTGVPQGGSQTLDPKVVQLLQEISANSPD